MNYNELTKCLICDNEKLINYIDFNQQPLANSYVKSKDVQENTFPLKVNLCGRCFHSQLSVSVNPSLLFENYLYISGTTKTLSDYFEWFVEYVESKFDDKFKVLELASNDGSLLSKFKVKGHNVLGVDPAKNLRELSREKDIPTIIDFWNMDLAKTLRESSDVVVGQNVLAHVSNPKEFLESCKVALRETGSIFIQTSQANMFKNYEFDTVYHEHISFFSASSFKELAKQCNLNIKSIIKVPIHGDSYLVEFVKYECDQSQIDNLIEEESSYVNIDNYHFFGKKVNDILNDTKTILDKYRKEGYIIVGYGAAAKGNTFINASSLELDFIVDDNEMKCGLYTPGQKIEIKKTSSLSGIEKMVVLILAWNFKKEIIEKVMKIVEKDVIFVSYFPELVEEIKCY